MRVLAFISLFFLLFIPYFLITSSVILFFVTKTRLLKGVALVGGLVGLLAFSRHILPEGFLISFPFFYLTTTLVLRHSDRPGIRAYAWTAIALVSACIAVPLLMSLLN